MTRPIALTALLLLAAPAAAAPVANPGGPYAILVGDSLLLDGSASYDPNSTSLAYQWYLKDVPLSAAPSPTIPWSTLSTYLSSPADYPANPVTHLPNVPLSLVVTDAFGSSSAGTTLTVYAAPEPASITLLALAAPLLLRRRPLR